MNSTGLVFQLLCEVQFPASLRPGYVFKPRHPFLFSLVIIMS